MRSGDWVIDATAGNGHDTAFLAERVGERGRVWAFDVQKAALESTARRLKELSLEGRVNLVHAGHETMKEQLEGSFRAVVFNLGYFPSGERELITQTKTTLQALEAASTLLVSGGMICCVCYPGHQGGGEEAEAVLEWIQSRGGEVSERVGIRPFLATLTQK